MTQYTPTESAQAFHSAPLNKDLVQIKALWGGMGTGKSTAALWEFILMAMEADVPLRGVVVRSSYRELMDSTKPTFEEWFGEFGADIAEWKKSSDEGDHFVIRLPNKDGQLLEHKLRFRALQTPQDTQKLQSTEYCFLFMEECVPAFSTAGVIGQGLPEEILKIGVGRMRQKGVKERVIVCTANPPSPSHWFHSKFIAAHPRDLARMNALCVFQPKRDNEPNLPQGYYDSMRALMDEDMARRFIDGEIVTFYPGTRCFPEAKDHVHIIDTPIALNKQCELVLGHDFGLTPATLITQVLPTGQWVWLDELVTFNMSVDTHFELLRTKLNGYPYKGLLYRSWGDPSGVAKSQTDAKSAFDIALAKGFQIKPGKVDWQNRKEAMKQRLTRTVDNFKPALLVSRQGCPVASEGLLGGYRYPQNASGEIGTRPIKNSFSHVMDAAQYIATGEFSTIVSREELVDLANALIVIPKFNPLADPPKKKDQRPSWICT